MTCKASYRSILCCVVALLCGLPSASAEEKDSSEQSQPAASTKEIENWIAQLDDNRYLVREQATRDLLAQGAAALDPLLAAANSDKPEPAERAVWILRRLGKSRGDDLAMAALERLTQLRDRPLLVEKAELELADRSIAVCEQHLTPLGAEVLLQFDQIDGATIAPMLYVRIGPQWQGTTDDVICVARLRHQQYFRLEGAAIDDSVVKAFEEREKLSHLQLRDTRVTPAAIDALKRRHPEAVVYVRNSALLGISAVNHPNGVLVQHVQPGTAAAAAGIVPGDVIATLAGHPLPDFDRLTARIAQHRPGDMIDVEVIRGNERQKISVTLGSWTNQP